MRECALKTLWAVAALAAYAHAFTVDCNHEYTDCDQELSKLTNDDEENPSSVSRVRNLPSEVITSSTTLAPTITTIFTTPVDIFDNKTDNSEVKPKARLLNLSMDELQSFANALHNQTLEEDTNNRSNKKILPDLSDVNLDTEDEDDHHRVVVDELKGKDKTLPDKFYSNLQAPFHPLTASERGSEELEVCKENGVIYKVGDKIDRNCDESCECSAQGMFECSPRCKHPYIRRGRRLNDPLCFESPIDECCSIIACATGTQEDLKASASNQQLDVCRYGNDTYTVGQKWNIGCQQVCSCEHNSVVTCKPRCAQLPASDRCINVQDPNDACCEVQVCDVSNDDHEERLENSTVAAVTIESDTNEIVNTQITTIRPLVLAEPIGSVKVLQNNSVQVNLIHKNSTGDPIHLLLSSNGGKNFSDVELKYSNLLLNLEGGKDYVLKTKETGTNFNFTITTLDNAKNEVQDNDLVLKNISKAGCYEDGKFYEVGEEFHIGCTELCECTGPDDTRECATLQCPAHVGLELVSRGCVRWAPSPPLKPPNCCPRTARCISDGTCHYDGHAVPNWSEVPISLTGCEKRCFCENGDLDCQEVCSPLPPVPPQSLRCPTGHHPAPVNISDEDCCKQWACVKNGITPADFMTTKVTQAPIFLPTIPPEINYPREEMPDYDENNIHHTQGPVLPTNTPHIPPGYAENNKKLTMISLQADSPTSVKMLFGLPPVLVGLKGSVDLRFTDKQDDDISHWYSQVFAPADEILTTPRLEFRLTGLKPSTTYRLRGKLFLHNVAIEPQSDIFSVRTLDAPSIEEKRKEVDSRLVVIDVNDTTAQIRWRHFKEEELQFIDGIQVRYRPMGQPIYSMTELLHHSRSTAELHELRPGTRYEASLVLIPPPRALTELYDPAHLEFTTLPFVDPYNWSVSLDSRAIGSEAVELTWRGVPAPPERWVRVYRAAHACGSGRAHEHDAFRLAAHDQPPTITLTGLQSNARCRVWLELFLTNGKVKTSNVLEISTKMSDSNEPIDNIVESSIISGGSSVSGGRGTVNNNTRGDYYGALVVVGVVAALGALTSLLLLLVVVRRHRPHSVPITPVPSAPRESSLPPYDNPAYKLELQQETMDL